MFLDMFKMHQFDDYTLKGQKDVRETEGRGMKDRERQIGGRAKRDKIWNEIN